MALFYINNCAYNGCNLHFASLYDLLQHIEETHIRRLFLSPFFHCHKRYFLFTYSFDFKLFFKNKFFSNF